VCYISYTVCYVILGLHCLCGAGHGAESGRGEIGRRWGLKHPFLWSTGSSPVVRTNQQWQCLLVHFSISPEIRLELRKNSRFYQVVLKASDGKWRRYSAKTENRLEAEDFARQKLAEWKVLAKHGVSLDKKTFDFVAKQYISEVKNRYSGSTLPGSQEKYIRIVEQWLSPFFGRYPIDKVDDALIDDFELHRSNIMGKEPAKSTINKHNIVLRAILNLAVKKKWLSRGEIPRLTVKNKGIASERRGFFEPEDWNKLIAFLTDWRNASRRNGLRGSITRHKRDMLRSYVYLITMSGLRPGNESLKLKWDDFQLVPATKKQPSYYKVYIRSGKKAGRGRTGAEDRAHRFIVIDRELFEHLEILKSLRTGQVEADDLVFCMQDGSAITDFPHMFSTALELSGLKVSIAGEDCSLYSLRHTYATWNLRRGATYEQLKTQMGTSVAMLQKHYDHATADTWADRLLLGQPSGKPLV
jgi:integrase